MTQEEKVFLDTPSAKVTSARVVIGNQTFAMSGITSVDVRKEVPERKFIWGAFFVLLGITVAKDNTAQGLLLAAVGVVMSLRQWNKRDEFQLILRAAGGEVTAYTSLDSASIEIVAKAITEAMVFRG